MFIPEHSLHSLLVLERKKEKIYLSGLREKMNWKLFFFKNTLVIKIFSGLPPQPTCLGGWSAGLVQNLVLESLHGQGHSAGIQFEWMNYIILGKYLLPISYKSISIPCITCCHIFIHSRVICIETTLH